MADFFPSAGGTKITRVLEGCSRCRSPLRENENANADGGGKVAVIRSREYRFPLLCQMNRLGKRADLRNFGRPGLTTINVVLSSVFLQVRIPIHDKMFLLSRIRFRGASA